MIRVSAVLFGIVTWLAVIVAQPPKDNRPVEVWIGGDDGYTQRLRNLLEDMFSRSPNVQMSNGKKPGTLLVTIPNHVAWKRMEKRTLIMYDVEFSIVGRKGVNKKSGSCWGDNMKICANAILQEATRNR